MSPRLAFAVPVAAVLLALAGAIATTPSAAQPAPAGSVASGAGTAAPSPAGGVEAELKQLLERAIAALRTEPETLFRLTEQGLALLEHHPDADIEIQLRRLRCDYFNERDRTLAQREIELMRQLAPKLKQPGHRAAALGCEGELHEQSGDNTRAMALYEQAVGVAEAARDDRRLAEVLYLRGYLRGVLGDFAQGLADLKRSLALYERLALRTEMRTAVNAVASLYNRMGALDEARRFYEDALRTMPEGASRERAIATHNLGRNHERAGRWDEAQRMFEQTLAMSRELRYTRGEVHALRGMAAVRNAKGDGARALQLVDEAQRLYGQVPDEPARARLLLQRAISLRQLDRPAEGLAGLREAIRIFVAGDAVIEEGEAREELARAAAELGDWRQAYEQQTRARQITQELLRKQVDNRFATMRAQFDADARERELALLQREKLASERALAEQRRANDLQIVVAVLALTLAALLAVLAWRQHRARHQMQTLAMTDELTGLPNRRSALAALEARVTSGAGGAVLIMDIDHFKRINDRHGHVAGDAVLRATCSAWRVAAGHAVVLGRLGGEEFVAIGPDRDLAQAAALAERLRVAVASLDLSTPLGLPQVTTSIGVTVLGPGDSVAAAMSRADVALYRAKEAGRNRVETQP